MNKLPLSAPTPLAQTNHKITALCLSAFVIYLLPMILLGQNAIVPVHDSLDADLAWYKVLATSGAIFDKSAIITPIMNGIPRPFFTSSWNVNIWLYYFFAPFTAYLLNYLLVHIIAFIGAYLLLKKHFVRDEAQYGICIGVAFCFAILPFYTIFGLSVAGQPLLLYAFLNLLLDRPKASDYLLITFFPFYSSFFFVGAFAIMVLGLVAAVVSLQKKQWHLPFWLGLGLLLINYLIVEWNLLEATFIRQTFVSNRTDWIHFSHVYSDSFRQAVGATVSNFVNGQYHTASLQRWILLLVVPLTAVASFLQKKRPTLLFTLLTFALAFAILRGFEHWPPFIALKDLWPKLHLINIRFYWLQPTVWTLIFAVGLTTLAASPQLFGLRTSTLVAALLLFQALFVLSANVEVMEPLKRFVGLDDPRQFTFAGFYSEPLFQDIKAFIGQPQENYRVVSLGIYPAVAQYNGFYTLDSYQNNYPLAYKQQFRQAIERELAKSPALTEYIDGWGNRLYLFSAELGTGAEMTKDKHEVVKHWELNTAVLKQMGARYIFSAVEIQNYAENGLIYRQTFERTDSPWRIYLYEIP